LIRAEEPLVPIGEVAERFGVTLRTLRFYEQRRLLSPVREGPRRLYGTDQLTRLGRILAAKRLGLSLHEIERLLAEETLSLSQEEVEAQIAHLEQQRADIEAALAELRAMLPVG
jgi:DNA-binding transcriptional MerR regulator